MNKKELKKLNKEELIDWVLYYEKAVKSISKEMEKELEEHNEYVDSQFDEDFVLDAIGEIVFEFCEQGKTTIKLAELIEIANKMYGGIRRYGHPSCKPVIQYDINGRKIKEYKSTIEAGKPFKHGSTNIGKCCNGKLKTAYGYVWKYK